MPPFLTPKVDTVVVLVAAAMGAAVVVAMLMR